MGEDKDLGEGRSDASQVLPTEPHERGSASEVEAALLAAIRALGPEAVRRVVEVLAADLAGDGGVTP